MIKKSQIRRDVFAATTDMVIEVNNALQELFSKKLWRVNETDALKLLKLKVWSHRYSVDLKFILKTVIPYFSKAVQRRTGKKSKGIGVSIATLTGEVAEEILASAVTKEFPGNEHVYAAIEEKRQQIELMLVDEELPTKPKGVLQYNSVKEHVDAYSKKIESSRVHSTKLKEKLGKQSWRGNPFR